MLRAEGGGVMLKGRWCGATAGEETCVVAQTHAALTSEPSGKVPWATCRGTIAGNDLVMIKITIGGVSAARTARCWRRGSRRGVRTAADRHPQRLNTHNA